MKALIFYVIRYYATKETSEVIAKTLGEENFDVKVVNAQKEKVEEVSALSEYSIF